MPAEQSDHYSLVGERDPLWLGTGVVLCALSLAWAFAVGEVFVHLDDRLMFALPLFGVVASATQTYLNGGFVVNAVLGVAPLAPVVVVFPPVFPMVALAGLFLGVVGCAVGVVARSIRQG